MLVWIFFFNVKSIDQAFMDFFWGEWGVKVYVWIWVGAEDI